MRFSLEYLREILPAENPPLELVPQAVREFSEFRDVFRDEPIRRSLFWTYAIFNELREGEFETKLEGDPALWPLSERWRHFPFWYFLPSPFSVGALDQDYEGSGFGLIVSIPFLKSGIVGEFYFRRLGRSFPVARRSLVEDPHSPPSLTSATSACWALENGGKGAWGFMTCRHAVSGVSPGTVIPLNGGGTAVVKLKAPPTIDAAFVASAPPVAPLQPLGLVTYPAAGQPVEVQLPGGKQSRAVVSVTDTLGVIGDAYHPIKVYLDQPCQAGDSGALVQAPTGEGVAIYCGAMTNATVRNQTGQTVGFAQHLEQAVTILDVSPYL